MSMLSVIQHFCERQNLPIPLTVYGSTDKQVVQVKALLEEEGNDIAKRGPWNTMVLEAAWTTVATEDQGAITTIAPNGFDYIVNQTIWDRSIRLPVAGPMNEREWQTLKAMFVNGPRYKFRIRGNKMIVNPVPPAGNSWYFEYVTKYWITDSVGHDLSQLLRRRRGSRAHSRGIAADGPALALEEGKGPRLRRGLPHLRNAGEGCARARWRQAHAFDG